MVTGVLVLVALWLVCALATLCVASRLARQSDQHLRHGDRHEHSWPAPHHDTLGEPLQGARRALRPRPRARRAGRRLSH
ncbi:hypothetical protein [Dactylosporangium sp. NPDC048998]|uniref:hypothetical protein n=1 Tax=Dactylosporangium sp. NPDC048998 TaxID=3363976 RepID=UPI003710290D